jgi:electron transfer flavoprotein beta subunit
VSSYNSIVLVKQVPDTARITGDAMNPNGTIKRSALPAIFNPEDLSALEAALEVKDRFGGSVTVVSMGPPKAADVLRDCLYRGADRAILITDRGAAGSDTLATSYILSQAVKKAGQFDFVFCGRQAIDGDTAQTGPQCAEKLGLPQVSYLLEIIDVKDGKATLKRSIGDGWETVRVTLPALVTVVKDANEPRPQSAIKIMRNKYKRAPAEGADPETLKPEDRLEQWSLADIEAEPARCGLAGSPTKVHRVESVVLKKEVHKSIEPTAEGISELVAELVRDHALG